MFHDNSTDQSSECNGHQPQHVFTCLSAQQHTTMLVFRDKLDGMELSYGDKAPVFTLPSTQGEVSLDALQGQWVVLYFYPKDDTPGCTVEACDFRDALPNMNATVLGVSADDVTSHEKFRDKFSLPFPLLADEGGKVSQAYGAYGEKKMYGKTFMGVFRSTFIIDPDGNIAEAMYQVKHDGHVAEVASKLEAHQTTS